MAKKKKAGVNKSKAIRDYLQANSGATNAEVVAALKKDGISVSSTYVSNVKSTSGLGGKKRKKRRTKKTAVNKPEPTPVQDMTKAGELMLQAFDLVTKAGYREAQALVKMANDFMRGKK